MYEDGCGGWSLAQVGGHPLHGLGHLVTVSEDEPGGKDVLEAAAAKAPIQFSIFGYILKEKTIEVLEMCKFSV